jgi:hypothetical protein
LIRLREKVEFTSTNEHIRPVLLPFDDDLLKKYFNMNYGPRDNPAYYTVMGFGQIATNTLRSNILMKAVVKSITNEECAAFFYKITFNSEYLCAKGSTTDSAKGKM